jgi:hypothetical protein
MNACLTQAFFMNCRNHKVLLLKLYIWSAGMAESTGLYPTARSMAEMINAKRVPNEKVGE